MKNSIWGIYFLMQTVSWVFLYESAVQVFILYAYLIRCNHLGTFIESISEICTIQKQYKAGYWWAFKVWAKLADNGNLIEFPVPSLKMMDLFAFIDLQQHSFILWPHSRIRPNNRNDNIQSRIYRIVDPIQTGKKKQTAFGFRIVENRMKSRSSPNIYWLVAFGTLFDFHSFRFCFSHLHCQCCCCYCFDSFYFSVFHRWYCLHRIFNSIKIP